MKELRNDMIKLNKEVNSIKKDIEFLKKLEIGKANYQKQMLIQLKFIYQELKEINKKKDGEGG